MVTGSIEYVHSLYTFSGDHYRQVTLYIECSGTSSDSVPSLQMLKIGNWDLEVC